MKRLFITAMVLGLFAIAPAALAQDQHDQGVKSEQGAKSEQGNKSEQGAKSEQGSKSEQSAKSVQGNKSEKGATSGRGGNTFQSGKSEQSSKSGQGSNSYQGSTSGKDSGYNETRTQGHVGNAPSVRAHKTVTSTRTSGTIAARRAADLPSLRRNVQAPQHFHAGDYRPPQGYQARHWSYGERLPRDYFARDYWLTDYFMYALFAPPDGYVWVRVGDDALLIDEETGEIIRVEYGVFY